MAHSVAVVANSVVAYAVVVANSVAAVAKLVSVLGCHNV